MGTLGLMKTVSAYFDADRHRKAADIFRRRSASIFPDLFHNRLTLRSYIIMVNAKESREK